MNLREALTEDAFNKMLEAELGIDSAKEFASKLAADSDEPPDEDEVKDVRFRNNRSVLSVSTGDKHGRCPGSSEDWHLGAVPRVRVLDLSGYTTLSRLAPFASCV